VVGARVLSAACGPLVCRPYVAAERGYIDDVIVPHETRPKVITALHTLQTKPPAGTQAQARQHSPLARGWVQG